MSPRRRCATVAHTEMQRTNAAPFGSGLEKLKNLEKSTKPIFDITVLSGINIQRKKNKRTKIHVPKLFSPKLEKPYNDAVAFGLRLPRLLA